MTRFVRWAAVAAASALLATGCSGSSSDGAQTGDRTSDADSSAPSTGSSATALPSSLTAQKLDWGDCKATGDSPAPGDEWRCATLKTPLDWAKPEGRTIDVALIRTKATGEDRIGSLLFNFGGPGSSGVSTMPWYADSASELGKRYDLVSFDPRGVGASEGVRCRSDKEIQASESV
ncbi:alpha/beta hydrolase, partial [Streptomyces chartreusis]